MFFFSSRRRHTRYIGDWSSDVCSSDLRSQGCCAGKHGQDLDHACQRSTLVTLPPTTERNQRGGIAELGRSEERRVGKEGRCRWWQEAHKDRTVRCDVQLSMGEVRVSDS